MATVIPATPVNNWGGDLLNFALQLSGQKIQREQLETERELRVAQAAGLKEQTKELQAKNEFLQNATPEQKVAYYLQDALYQQNRMLQLQVQQSQAAVENMLKQQAAERSDALAMQTLYQQQYGAINNAYADTPYGPVVAQASKDKFNVEMQAQKSPEMVMEAQRRYDAVIKDAAQMKADRELEVFKQRASVQQEGEITTQLNAAIIANQKALLANPDMFKGGETGQDYQNFVMAIATGQMMGKDFDLASGNVRWFPGKTLVFGPENKFTFVPGKNVSQPTLEQKLNSLKR